MRTGERLAAAAIVGGLLIIAAFLLLCWSTYREMDEERRKRYAFRIGRGKNPLTHFRREEEVIDTSDDE